MRKINLNENFYINNRLVYVVHDDDMYYVLDAANDMEYGAASSFKDAVECAKEILSEDYSEYKED